MDDKALSCSLGSARVIQPADYVHGRALDWRCAAVTLRRPLAAEGEQHGVIDGERGAIGADRGWSVGFSDAAA